MWENALPFITTVIIQGWYRLLIQHILLLLFKTYQPQYFIKPPYRVQISSSYSKKIISGEPLRKCWGHTDLYNDAMETHKVNERWLWDALRSSQNNYEGTYHTNNGLKLPLQILVLIKIGFSDKIFSLATLRGLWKFCKKKAKWNFFICESLPALYILYHCETLL